MAHGVADVGDGVQVHVVVVQGLGVHRRARLSQEDPEPPAQLLAAARLEGGREREGESTSCIYIQE